MKHLDFDGLKKVELEILDVVAKFCDEHEIQYGLCYGTLIGAIRHKGFIPWDDDIDLVMLRPDYEKFIKLFNKYNTRYHFSCIENEPDYPRYFGRVIDTDTILYDQNWKSNVNVEIFCWDHAPDDDRILQKMFRKAYIYWRLYCMQFSGFSCRVHNVTLFNFPRKIAKFIYKVFLKIILSFLLPKNYFAKKMTENAKKYMNENTKRWGSFLAITHVAVGNHVFEKFIDAEFEGRMYKIPVGYDELLRKIYGDYMTLPPEEERVTHHDFEAYIKD